MKLNEENEQKAINVINKLSNNMTYEEIAAIYNTNKDYLYRLVRAYKPVFGIEGVISKYDALKISGEINNVIADYLDNVSTEELGRRYNASDRTVVSWLLKEGVEIRDRGKILKVEQTIFDNIDSEIKAYTIGLITADGSISKKGNNITICLTEQDKYLLELININLLDSLGTIVVSHKEDTKPRYVLSFNGKHIKKRLSDFGIVPNKTYSLKSLTDLIPDEYYHHYIRGLFDGDGVCAYYSAKNGERKVRVGFCAYEQEFVEDYRDFLNKTLNFPKNKLFNTGGCWQCSWSAFNDVKKFTDYIYKDATIFLGRKKKKLFDYVNTEVN